VVAAFAIADPVLHPEGVDDLRPRVSVKPPVARVHRKDVEGVWLLGKIPSLVPCDFHIERALRIVGSVPPAAVPTGAVGHREGLDLGAHLPLHVVEKRLDSVGVNTRQPALRHEPRDRVQVDAAHIESESSALDESRSSAHEGIEDAEATEVTGVLVVRVERLPDRPVRIVLVVRCLRRRCDEHRSKDARLAGSKPLAHLIDGLL
jgi:hypothetical protein